MASTTAIHSGEQSFDALKVGRLASFQRIGFHRLADALADFGSPSLRTIDGGAPFTFRKTIHTPSMVCFVLSSSLRIFGLLVQRHQLAHRVRQVS